MDGSTIDYDELVIQLQVLSLDLYSHRITHQQDLAFTKMVKEALSQDFLLAEVLTRELDTACGKKLSEEQKAYLAVHLHRINKGKEGVKDHGTV